jgi:DNA mismatch endonuclease (patch repair protein)
MVDRLDPLRRSRLMSRIGSVNTRPEIQVRSMLHRMGCRFRLHVRSLPGTPDVVLPARGAVVFVHGCFWHGHRCKRGKMPKSRVEYWDAKIHQNRRRDASARRSLRRLGWKVIVVWECDLRRSADLADRLARELGCRKYSRI